MCWWLPTFLSDNEIKQTSDSVEAYFYYSLNLFPSHSFTLLSFVTCKLYLPTQSCNLFHPLTSPPPMNCSIMSLVAFLVWLFFKATDVLIVMLWINWPSVPWEKAISGQVTNGNCLMVLTWSLMNSNLHDTNHTDWLTWSCFWHAEQEGMGVGLENRLNICHAAEVTI